MRYPKKISLFLAILCCLLVQSACSSGDSTPSAAAPVITRQDIEQGTLGEVFTHEGVEYRTYNVNGEIVNVTILPDGTYDYAFRRDNKIYYYQYKDDVLVTESITPDVSETTHIFTMHEIIAMLSIPVAVCMLLAFFRLRRNS